VRDRDGLKAVPYDLNLKAVLYDLNGVVARSIIDTMVDVTST
jgi:hypothetical protein